MKKSEEKKREMAKKMGGKESYLNRERKTNADFMRKAGYGDVLSNRKSIGRNGKKQ